MSSDATQPDPQNANSETFSKASNEELQQRYQQFLEMLPLTLALAGLPTSEGRLYSEEQIEGRAITIRAAYRVAKTTVREVLGGS